MALAIGNSCDTPGSAPTPRLVVVISVDQMRADYLDRFDAQFTGGLRWLIDNGLRFTKAHHDHATTSTGPGHTTLGTGVFPSHHGIVGNDYYDRRLRRSTYSMADSTSAILNYPEAPGRSPANLLHDGLGDWLKAQSPESKVYSVAIKDRAAIPLAGKGPDGAYWFHLPTGDFITSEYYRSEYPAWVTEFNQSDRSERFCGTHWTKLFPDSAYALSREDDFPYERDSMGRVFPHLLTGTDGLPDARYFGRIPETPFGDQLTLEFAGEMMRNEGLGLDEHVDLLFIGLSAADYIGHRYGPYSQEVQDYYLRLDRMLADFFTEVEEITGADRYVVALSADHGVMVIPEELSRRGVDAARVEWRPIPRRLNEVAAALVEDGTLASAPRVRDVTGFVFDFGDWPPSPEQMKSLAELLTAELRLRPEFSAAYTFEQVITGSGSGPIFDKLVRSVHPDRGADILYAPREYYYLTNSQGGTSHGSPYEYDTHVPLVFVGAGFSAELRDEPVRTVDLAPTLAAMLNLTLPADLDGRDLRTP
jgi:predicted AlkP superfamily pyrophosphatase or phosphodiesterase